MKYKVHIEIVTCWDCPHRSPMCEHHKDSWNEEYDGRYLCTNEDNKVDGNYREIKLHASLDYPDWCKMPNYPEKGLESLNEKPSKNNVSKTPVRYPDCMGEIDPDNAECRKCKIWELCFMVSKIPEQNTED